ncbi:MAG: GAF domain-containing protein [Chloroflexi bacterium]|nr:GAF domain-containing protein [Chloroflexota bacterium]
MRDINQVSELLSVVNTVGEALYSSDEPQEILDLIVDKLIEFLPVDCCWIQLLDEQSGQLNLLSHHGFTPEMKQELASMRLGQSLTGHVALSGKPLVIPDITTDTRYSLTSPTKAGMHSFAALPIGSEGRTRGVIGVASANDNQFTKEMIELLTVLGNHVGIALDKAKLYQQTKARVEESQQSEEKYKSLFENANDAILLADARTGYIIDANREAERLLGCPLREIIGMHQAQLHPQDKVDYYSTLFQHHTEEKSTAVIEAEVIRKGGTIVPVYMSSSIVPLHGRKLIQEIFKDVSAYRRAERDIRVKDIAMASFINGFALADLDGKLTYVNRSFLTLWGYDDERDVLGKPAVGFWHRSEQEAEVIDALKTTGSWIGELSAMKMDGSTFDVQLSANMVKDEMGKPICMMASFVDITERKLNEQKVLEQSQRLSATSQLAKTISSEVDISEVFESFAQQLRGLLNFERLSVSLIEGNKTRFFAVSSMVETELDTDTTVPLDYSATGWVAKNKTTLIQPDLAQESRFPLDKIRLKHGLRSSIHVPLFHKGKVFGSLNLSSTEPNAYGEKAQEIAEQLAAQIAGAIQNANLYTQERASRLELERQKEEWLHFTSVIAHELKTPLTSIIAGAELLSEELQGEVPEPHQKLVQNIVRSAHTLETNLDELLDITKMRSMVEVELSPLNIKGLIEQVTEYLRPIAERKEQSLVLDLAEFLPSVNADARRLEQVLRNLLMNAVKFTPPGGYITLRARKQESSLVVEIQDSGIGIAKERQAKLFEPYYRGEADRELFPGMGLGLALSKQIVELHGGRIWVESQPAKGSIFAFSLPL